MVVAVVAAAPDLRVIRQWCGGSLFSRKALAADRRNAGHPSDPPGRAARVLPAASLPPPRGHLAVHTPLEAPRSLDPCRLLMHRFLCGFKSYLETLISVWSSLVNCCTRAKSYNVL